RFLHDLLHLVDGDVATHPEGDRASRSVDGDLEHVLLLEDTQVKAQSPLWSRLAGWPSTVADQSRCHPTERLGTELPGAVGRSAERGGSDGSGVGRQRRNCEAPS